MIIDAAPGLSLKINAQYQSVGWVYEGQKVIVPVTADGKETGLHCVVVVAGVHARVENKRYGFARWYAIEDLRVEVAEEEGTV